MPHQTRPRTRLTLLTDCHNVRLSAFILMAGTTNQDDTRASLEEIWYLKEITFKLPGSEAPQQVKIITQNYNG